MNRLLLFPATLSLLMSSHLTSRASPPDASPSPPPAMVAAPLPRTAGAAPILVPATGETVKQPKVLVTPKLVTIEQLLAEIKRRFQKPRLATPQ